MLYYLLDITFECDFNYLNEPDRDGFKISVENKFIEEDSAAWGILGISKVCFPI